MQDFFLLDICSSKDSRSARVSLASAVNLLTSGEASDPSTLGYDGKPSQENVTFTEKEQRLSHPGNFVLTTNLPASMRLWRSDALYLEFTQVRRNGIVVRLHAISVCQRTVRRVCARPSNHVRKSHPQRFVIDILDGR